LKADSLQMGFRFQCFFTTANPILTEDESVLALENKRYRFGEFQICSAPRWFWKQQATVIRRNNLRYGGSVLCRMEFKVSNQLIS
jgi:hypothetical protein